MEAKANDGLQAPQASANDGPQASDQLISPRREDRPHSPRYALVFATARWCEPGVPMRVIFDELIRDLERRVVEARSSRDSLSALSSVGGVRGVVVDIDEVDAILASKADDAASGRPPDPTLELDPLITPAFAESIDFVPMIILMREGNPPTKARAALTEKQAPEKPVTLTEKQASEKRAASAEITLPKDQARPTKKDQIRLTTTDQIRPTKTEDRNGGVNRPEFGGEELARFVGQLPKLHIRDRILRELSGDLRPPAA